MLQRLSKELRFIELPYTISFIYVRMHLIFE